MANYDIPTYPIRRLRYYNNQFLKEQDFIDEQARQLSSARAHLRSLCVAGVCEGLTVRLDAGKLLVAPGVAIDAGGQMIALDAEKPGPSASTLADDDYLLHVRFHEDEDVMAPPIGGGAQGNTRWTQRPILGATRTGTALPPGAVVLGTFSVVQAAVTAISIAGRRYSGIRFPGPSADGAATLANRSDGSADGLRLGGDLTMRRDVSGGKLGPTLTLTNGVAYPGGAGSGAALDFNAYDPGINAPALRLQAVGDNAGSSHLAIATKQPGGSTNNLVERLRITSLGVLQFSNDAQDKLVVYEGGPTDRYGLGLNTANLNLFCPPSAHLSLRQSSSSGTEVFSVSGTGALSVSSSVSTPSLNAQNVTITGGLTVSGSTNLAGLSAGSTSLGSLAVSGSTNLAGLNAQNATISALTVSGPLRIHGANEKILFYDAGPTDRYGLGIEDHNISLFCPPSGRLSLRQNHSSGPEVFTVSGTGALSVSSSVSTPSLNAQSVTITSGLAVSGSTNLAGLSAGGTSLGSLSVSGPATFSGPIIPRVGNDASSGIQFPSNPGGGSGDEAFLRYSVQSGDAAKLTLGINNDPDDALVLWQGGAERITIANDAIRMSNSLSVNGSVSWGAFECRTEHRGDAGLRGDAGARSGFYNTSTPTNYPPNAQSYWHLLDVRHSDPSNNYAMQIAGSYYDQELWFRKTNNDANQPWRKFVSADSAGNVGIQGDLYCNRTIFSGPIVPQVGADQNSGIRFPINPGGGGGDEAFLTYSVGSGEATTLTLGINNDPDDALVLWQAGAQRIRIANGIVRIYGQLVLDSGPYYPPPPPPPPTSPPPPPPPPPPTCLLKGQRLVMSDLSLKNIEDIRAGDIVFTAHEKTGALGHYQVTRTISSRCDTWYNIQTASGRQIKCSPTHLFMVDGFPKAAQDIRISDALTIFTEGTFTNDPIQNIDVINEPTTVYNVEVEQAHTYLTANMILHHNNKEPV